MARQTEVLTRNNGQPLWMRVVATGLTWGEARRLCIKRRKKGYLAQQHLRWDGWRVISTYGRQRAPRRCDIS